MTPFFVKHCFLSIRPPFSLSPADFTDKNPQKKKKKKKVMPFHVLQYQAAYDSQGRKPKERFEKFVDERI